MKLSDIRGERTLDVIAAILSPITKIAKDEEATEFLRVRTLKDGENAKEVAIERVTKCVPIILSRYKKEIIEIFSAIEGVTYDEYVNTLNIVKLASDCIGILTDSEFVELFMSAQNTQASSMSAQESTTGDL